MTVTPKSAARKPRPTQPLPAQGQSTGTTFSKHWLAWSGLLVALTVLAYLPTLKAGFIWDDDDYIIQNQTLRTLSGLGRIWFEPTSIPQYYPIVHTSFWLEYHLWGLRPFGYHLINILLHALAAVLLGRALTRLRVPGAWLAAAIFALHPIEVESVAWVTERKNVLSAIFYFTSALAYWRFAPPEAGLQPSRRLWSWYALALALFVAALLSKTVTCSLPAALLLVHWWKTGRLRMNDVLPLALFFFIGAGLGLGTAWLERHRVGALGAEWSQSFLERCLIAGRAVWFYAAKLFWPARLTFIYPRWHIDAAQWWQWLFPLAVLGVVIGLWLVRGQIGRGPLVAVLFFIGTLGPALGFLNVYPMRYSFVADHFQYLAGAGLIALAARGLNRVPRSGAAVLPLVLAWLTWQQTAIYHDLEKLWRDTLSKNPHCWLAHNNLGLELENRGRYDEAFQQYAEALELAPAYFEAYNNMGNALMRKGRLEEAIADYQKAIALKPEYVPPHNSLGAAYGMQGQYAKATAELREALRLKPDYPRAHANLGNVLRIQKDLDGAIREYQEALRLEPLDPSVHKNLGLAYEDKALYGAAVEHYRESLRLEPNAPEVLCRLGLVLAQINQREEAVTRLKQALQLNPRLQDAREALRLLEASGPR